MRSGRGNPGTWHMCCAIFVCVYIYIFFFCFRIIQFLGCNFRFARISLPRPSIISRISVSYMCINSLNACIYSNSRCTDWPFCVLQYYHYVHHLNQLNEFGCNLAANYLVVAHFCNCRWRALHSFSNGHLYSCATHNMHVHFLHNESTNQHWTWLIEKSWQLNLTSIIYKLQFVTCCNCNSIRIA